MANELKISNGLIVGASTYNVVSATNKLQLLSSSTGVDFTMNGYGYARMFFADSSGASGKKLFEFMNYTQMFQVNRLDDANGVRTTLFQVGDTYTNNVNSLYIGGTSGLAIIPSALTGGGAYSFATTAGDYLIAPVLTGQKLTLATYASGIKISDANIQILAGSGSAGANMIMAPQGMAIGTTVFTSTESFKLASSVTASAGTGRGAYYVNPLTASQNADTLIGLDINPTYALGTYVASLGVITGGSGYVNGTYNNVTLTASSGPGSGALANLVVSGGAVTAVTIVSGKGGTGYSTASVLTAPASSLGGTGSGFSVPVATVGATSTTNYALRAQGNTSTTGIANFTGGVNISNLTTTGFAWSGVANTVNMYAGSAWVNIGVKSGTTNTFHQRYYNETDNTGNLYITLRSNGGLSTDPPLYNVQPDNNGIVWAVGRSVFQIWNNIQRWQGVSASALYHTRHEFTGNLLTLGTVYAASNLVQGGYINNALTATANNDALVGLDVNPSFVLGTHINALGTITGGSGYVDGTYNGVVLTNVSGPGGGTTANITVSGGAVTAVTLVNKGINYNTSTIVTTANTNLGGTGSGFQAPVASIGYQTTTKYGLRVQSGLTYFAGQTIVGSTPTFGTGVVFGVTGLAFFDGNFSVSGTVQVDSFSSYSGTVPVTFNVNSQNFVFKGTFSSGASILTVNGVSGAVTAAATLGVSGKATVQSLNVTSTYTPTSSSDANGAQGDIAWDGSYIYVKTGSGWMRSALSSF